MNEFIVVANKIYRFILMKEAFETGFITADTWKETIEQLMISTIEAYKKGASDETWNSDRASF